MGDSNEKEMTFWEHLDELRKVFFRMALAVLSWLVSLLFSKIFYSALF